MAIEWSAVRRLALALPGVEEKRCHGTAAFYVRGKIMARLQEDGETLSVAYPKAERDDLIDAAPDVFSVTPHFQNYDYVLMNLHGANAALMARHLELAWRAKATRRAVADFEAQRKA